MTAVLAFLGACLAVAAPIMGWRFVRAFPAEWDVAAQLRTGRARLAATIARLAADVSTLEPGKDPAARRQLADAAERLATARDLYERADTPEEVLAVATTLTEGTRSANRVRARLGLPKRKLPAMRRHRELVRRTRGKPRIEYRWARRERWLVRIAIAVSGGLFGTVWCYIFIDTAERPVSLSRWFLAWLPLAGVAVAYGYDAVSTVRRSWAKQDALTESYAAAEALLARIAGRLADPAAGRASDVEVVAEAYTEALERLAAARTVDDVQALTAELEVLISAAQGAERTG